MDHVTPRLLVAWLVGALALSLAVVGCGTITSQDPPVNRVISRDEFNNASLLLGECTMSNGDSGLQFDDLCLPAPPAGWTGPRRMFKPASLLENPQTGGCKSDSAEEFAEI